MTSGSPSFAAGGRLVLGALCLLAVVLLAADAPAQDAAPVNPPSLQHYNLPPPFLFRRRSQPSPRFSKEQLDSWMTLVARHRPGEADDSIHAIARLTRDELADIVSAFEWGADQVLEVTRQQRDLALKSSARADFTRRAVLLHTDFAMFVAAASSRYDVVNDSAQASLHFGVALELVDVLRRREPKSGDDPFVVGWWRGVAAFLGEWRETVSAPSYMQQAVSLFPDDPQILLMAGVMHELLASPIVQGGAAFQPELREVRGSEAENLADAEQCYRGALRNDPRLVEARVRLGRVLAQRRKYEQAIAELNAVPDAGTPPSLQYLKLLLLGEAEEGLNRADAARAAYGRALALYPGAQSAHLALSRLERRSGERDRAVAVIQQVLERPPDDRQRQDPWRDYFTAEPARHADEMIDALRAPFRGQP
jgi:hypothetical protein